MNKINSGSITKIIYYSEEKSFDGLINELDYFNIIFTKNGVFNCIKNKLFIVFKKINNLKYKNIELNSIDDLSIIQLIRKPEKEILDTIIEIFSYVNGKVGYEFIINLYYDVNNNNFVLDYKNQKISQTSVNYEYNAKYENSDEYIRYLQVHSHQNMKAYFSSIDDSDEEYSCASYFGVIGNIGSKYNIQQKYRIFVNEFIDISPDFIFNGLDKKNILLPSVKNSLNSIIEGSEIKNVNIRQLHCNLNGEKYEV